MSYSQRGTLLLSSELIENKEHNLFIVIMFASSHVDLQGCNEFMKQGYGDKRYCMMSEVVPVSTDVGQEISTI